MEVNLNPHAADSISPNGASRACVNLSVGDPQQESPRDLLTVFQANPIARTGPDNKDHPMVLLDLDSERRRLTKSLKKAVGDRIKIVFQIATTELLGDFISKGEGEILHFSCHGHPQYLAIEDNWGHAQALRVEELKTWFQLGGKSLRFVFVSACQSRTAGDAFVEAGVPHVVCIKSDKEEVNNAVAIEFELTFYRNLARGLPLHQAFDLAQHEVSVNPLLCSLNPSEESNKFVILPEGACHDVPIFFTQKYLPMYEPKNAACTAAFPPAPEHFIGRELQMFHVIDALKLSRLVRVSGKSGMGKNALVKACCHYISYRSYMFEDILWLPWRHEEKNAMCDCFSHLICSFQGKNCQSTVAESSCSKIIKHFRNRRSLLVFDAKMINSDTGMQSFNAFLEELLGETRYVRVIVLLRPNRCITTRNVREVEIKVPALDLAATSTLFGWMCPYVTMRIHPEVGTPTEFARLFTPNKSRDPCGRLSNRVYTLLGQGIPGKIVELARTMTTALYKQLICISQVADIGSRVALDIRARSLRQEYDHAVEEEQLDHAEEIQELIDVIGLLRHEYPGLTELHEMAQTMNREKDVAISAKRFGQARQLLKKVQRIYEMIEAENEAAIAFGVRVRDPATGDTTDCFANKAKATVAACAEPNSISDDRKKDLHNETLRKDQGQQPAECNEPAMKNAGTVDTDPGFDGREELCEKESAREDHSEDQNNSSETIGSPSEVHNFPFQASSTDSEESGDVSVSTFSTLTRSIRLLDLDLETAAGLRDFDKAEQIDRKISSLKRRKERLLVYAKLQDELGTLTTKLNEATENRNWNECKVLHARMDSVAEKLREFGYGSDNVSVSTTVTHETRADLTKKIRDLDHAVWHAAASCDFEKAEQIDIRIARLTREKDRLLECAKLQDEQSELGTKLIEATEARNWSACKRLKARMISVGEMLREKSVSEFDLQVNESSAVARPASHTMAESRNSSYPMSQQHAQAVSAEAPPTSPSQMQNDQQLGCFVFAANMPSTDLALVSDSAQVLRMVSPLSALGLHAPEQAKKSLVAPGGIDGYGKNDTLLQKNTAPRVSLITRPAAQETLFMDKARPRDEQSLPQLDDLKRQSVESQNPNTSLSNHFGPVHHIRRTPQPHPDPDDSILKELILFTPASSECREEKLHDGRHNGYCGLCFRHFDASDADSRKVCPECETAEVQSGALPMPGIDIECEASVAPTTSTLTETESGNALNLERLPRPGAFSMGGQFDASQERRMEQLVRRTIQDVTAEVVQQALANALPSSAVHAELVVAEPVPEESPRRRKRHGVLRKLFFRKRKG